MIDPECGPDHTLAELRNTLITHGLNVAGGRYHANVIVVREPATPGERNKCAAMFRSGWLVSASQVLRSHGIFMKYRYGFKVAREIYMSDLVIARHPKITAAIGQACSWPGSCWKLIPTPATAKDRFATAKTRASQVVALATVGEGRLGMPCELHVLTKAAFLSSLETVGWSNSGGTA